MLRLVLVLLLFLVGCIDPSDNKDEDESDKKITAESVVEVEPVVETVVKVVSIEEFEGIRIYPDNFYSTNAVLTEMSDEKLASYTKAEQTLIAQKLLSTMYSGMNVNKIKKLLNSENFMASMLETVKSKKLKGEEIKDIGENIESHYIEYRYRPLQKALAAIYYTPLSEYYFDYYTAYILQQTILFSGAFELDSVSINEITNQTNYLFSELRDKKSMKIIVYNSLRTNFFWANFRSPEDNTREAMEIFLNLFGDELVPIASKACQNYSFDDRTRKLLVDVFLENTEALTLFEEIIYNCYDFHRVLVSHNNFVKTQVFRLVDYFFPKYSIERKDSIIGLILQSSPETYQDIVKQILFSEEYLLRSNKTKSVEEASFFIAKTTDWIPNKNFFRDMFRSMIKMEQRANSYKLGRSSLTPIDAKSLSYYRAFLRDRFVRDTKNDLFNQNDGGWSTSFIETLDVSSETAFINNVTRNFIGRNLSNEEMTAIESILGDDIDISSIAKKALLAKVIMDYSIVLLSEYYEYQIIGELNNE